MSDDVRDLVQYQGMGGMVAAVLPVMEVAHAIQRGKAISSLVKQAMEEGLDYGTIPGTAKPTLYKPGAEKLCTFFGLSIEFSLVQSVEDWMGKDHEGEPFFYYWYNCRLSRGGALVAEAEGSCNSWETRYRYRWVPEHEIPEGVNKAQCARQVGATEEFDFAIEKAETAGQYGKPQEYWDEFREAIAKGKAIAFERKTRSGKMYPAWRIESILFRIPNPNVHDQVNTLQKMATKRAFVAATLLAVNASDFFTQDMEDFADDTHTIVDSKARVVVDVVEPKEEPAPKQAPTLKEQRDNAPPATPRAGGIYRTEEAPRPVVDNAEGKSHWVSANNAWFWGEARGVGLADKDIVHSEFGVASMKDYPGTKDDAQRILNIVRYGHKHMEVPIEGIKEALGVQRLADYTGEFMAGKELIDLWLETQEKEA